MGLSDGFELFSRTVENRFVVALFDLILCGVIFLVVLRRWRRRAEPWRDKHHILLFLAFWSLGLSFALAAVVTGARLFLQKRLPEVAFDSFAHGLQFNAWLLLAASARHGSAHSPGLVEKARSRARLALWLLVPGSWVLFRAVAQGVAVTVWLDLANLFSAAYALDSFRRRPLDRRHLATGALAAAFAALLLHFGSSREVERAGSVILWNLEQSAWSLSLLGFAVALGEASHDLFDRVFVRLQIAFVLLASLMTLVILQAEKSEYLASLRSRSEQLAGFAKGHVDYFRQRGESLAAIVQGEDFLRRLALGFGNLPELKIVQITAGEEAATFEIDDNGAIHSTLLTQGRDRPPSRLHADDFFTIDRRPLTDARSGQVEFYGTRAFLDQHIRNRIVVIFSLFTLMVVFSTLMIGLVVRGASATIGHQAREIEQTERQLMQASKLAAIGGLAAGVAHEINNPATTILSRASYLLSEGSTIQAPSDREDLDAIVTQAQRIAQITRRLLMFSRPPALQLHPISIDRPVEAGLDSVTHLLSAGGVVVEKGVPPGLPRVLGDEDSLARAMENIFRNAIDAMPGGGTLRIGAWQEKTSGDRLRVEISDTGAGIEPETLARIFDPFFTTKEAGKGTGLGLSIVQSIIEEHRGTISAESRPGEGTIFTILLPAQS